jgi:hypothetical protein
MDLHDYRITTHAARRMRLRRIPEEFVALAILAPESVEARPPGRLVVQAHVRLGIPEKTYIVRVILDVDRSPPEVVTVYVTSKLSKYGKPGGNRS